jgi:hypothetical protein
MTSRDETTSRATLADSSNRAPEKMARWQRTPLGAATAPSSPFQAEKIECAPLKCGNYTDEARNRLPHIGFTLDFRPEFANLRQAY